MEDPVTNLYQRKGYPEMSYPVANPALTSFAARLGGLKTCDPSRARILEIGCASGHNLLALAMRWPEAELVGVDLAVDAIAHARRRAAEAGISNVTFHAADLREVDLGEGSFDYIIAHGFLSWVPDEVKDVLFTTCARLLSPSGIATISFNLECGWRDRMPVIEVVKRIQRERNMDEMQALEILLPTAEDDYTKWIINDMLAKGPGILPFDDFGPVNDPWPLDRFVATASAAGLRWLGESDPAENIPSSLDDEARAVLLPLAGDPLRMQNTADELARRTFRSCVLCRADAPLDPRVSTSLVLDFSVRMGKRSNGSWDGVMEPFVKILASREPQCVPVREIIEDMQTADIPALARGIFDAIIKGWLKVMKEPVRYHPEPLSPCELDPFRLLCAREKIPLVDAWLVSCAFPPQHYDLLAEMDGSKSIEELALRAEKLCPDLVFKPWLQHLAGRGMFS